MLHTWETGGAAQSQQWLVSADEFDYTVEALEVYTHRA
jgi:hypothetical protein